MPEGCNGNLWSKTRPLWRAGGFARRSGLRLAALLVALSVPLAACSSKTASSTSAATGSSAQGCSGSSAAPVGAPTLPQLRYALCSSLQAGAVPDLSHSIPSLAASADDRLKDIDGSCYSTAPDPAIPADAASLCASGDLNATRSIFLFGDSQAAMWQPAFTAIGKDRGYKVVLLAKPGCSPWVHPAGKGDAGCNDFVQREIQFANQLHPTLVVPLGMTLGWGNSVYPTSSQLNTEITTTFRLLQASGAHLATLSIIPELEASTNTTPQACLTVHASNPASCESLLWANQKANALNVALGPATKAVGATDIDTSAFFCSGNKCALFVQTADGVHLVYQDGQHMTITYSGWLSRALESQMAPLL